MKIVFAVLIAVVLLAIFFSNGIMANPILPGDANRNGIVTIADITYIERVILGYSSITFECDANLDGYINMADIVKVQRIILGLK